MLMVRRGVLEKFFGDPVWAARIKEAKTTEDFFRVLKDFCESEGFRVKKVDLQ